MRLTLLTASESAKPMLTFQRAVAVFHLASHHCHPFSSALTPISSPSKPSGLPLARIFDLSSLCEVKSRLTILEIPCTRRRRLPSKQNMMHLYKLCPVRRRSNSGQRKPAYVSSSCTNTSATLSPCTVTPSHPTILPTGYNLRHTYPLGTILSRTSDRDKRLDNDHHTNGSTTKHRQGRQPSHLPAICRGLVHLRATGRKMRGHRFYGCPCH
jgi:hypothetical protein